MKLTPKKQNFLFIILILLLAVGLFGLQQYQNMQNQTPFYAELYIQQGDTVVTHEISLEKDIIYHFDCDHLGQVHLQVENGAIRFIDSPCPDHICETYGWLSHENQFATCAPAAATVIITPKD